MVRLPTRKEVNAERCEFEHRVRLPRSLFKAVKVVAEHRGQSYNKAFCSLLYTALRSELPKVAEEAAENE